MNRNLPETAETYWRWGIPSIVLGLVTCLAYAISVFWVEPRVDVRYTKLIEDGLTAVQRGFGGGSSDEGGEKDSEDEFVSWVERVRESELAANRMIVRYPRDARYRRWSAELGLGLEWFIRERVRERGDGENAELLKLERLANQEYGRAVDAIRSAMRLEGEDARWARGWFLREEVGRWSGRSDWKVGEVEEYIERLRGFEAEGWSKRIEGRMCVQLGHLHQALSEEERRRWLEHGVVLLQEVIRGEVPGGVERFVDRVWLAEGLCSLQSERGIGEAREAIVEGAGLMRSEGRKLGRGERVELVDGFFRALVMVSGLSEAGVAVFSRLDGVSQVERRDLLDRVVASHFRLLVSGRSFSGSALAGIGVADWYRSAMRFRVDHPQVEGGLDAYFRGEGELASVVDGAGREDTMLRTLRIVRNGLGKGGDTQEGNLEGIEVDVSIGVMRYLVGRTYRGDVRWGEVQGVLDRLVDSQETVVELRLGRGLIARHCGEWEVALNDFRRVKEGGVPIAGVEELLLEAEQKVGGR